MENIDFVSIYRKYRSRAFNIGKFILGDEDEAEDVCQDVFETLFHMGRSVDFGDYASADEGGGGKALL